MKLVLFSAEWCAPCKQLKASVERKGVKVEDFFDEIHDTESDEGSEESTRRGVRGLPTVMLIKNDKEVGRFTGNDTNKLNEFYEKRGQ